MTDLASLTADQLAEKAVAVFLDSHDYDKAEWQIISDILAELQTRANQLEAMKLGYRGDSLVQALEAAEKERDEQADRGDDWCKRACAAEARLAETQKALEQIAAMDEPDMYAGTAERFRDVARAALTIHHTPE